MEYDRDISSVIHRSLNNLEATSIMNKSETSFHDSYMEELEIPKFRGNEENSQKKVMKKKNEKKGGVG